MTIPHTKLWNEGYVRVRWILTHNVKRLLSLWDSDNTVEQTDNCLIKGQWIRGVHQDTVNYIWRLASIIAQLI